MFGGVFRSCARPEILLCYSSRIIKRDSRPEQIELVSSVLILN